MGVYKLDIKTTAEHDFKNIDKQFHTRIESAIDKLAEDPSPQDVRSVSSKSGYFYIRVGHYRIIYSFDNPTQTVIINHIRRRTEGKDTYENL